MKQISIGLLLMLSLVASQAVAEELQPFSSPFLHNPSPKVSGVQQDWPQMLPDRGINREHWDEQHMNAERQTMPQQSVPHFDGRLEGWR